MSLYSTMHIQQIAPKSSVEIQQLPYDAETAQYVRPMPDPFRPAEQAFNRLAMLPRDAFARVLRNLNRQSTDTLRRTSRFLDQRVQQFPEDYKNLHIAKIKYSMYDACQVFLQHGDTEARLIEFPQCCLANNRIDVFEIYNCIVLRSWFENELIAVFNESTCQVKKLIFDNVELRCSQDLLSQFLVATRVTNISFNDIKQTRWALQAALFDMEWMNQVKSLNISNCELRARMRPEQLQRFNTITLTLSTVDGLTFDAVKGLIEEWFSGVRDISKFEINDLEGETGIPSSLHPACVVRRADKRRLYISMENKKLKACCLRRHSVGPLRLRIYQDLPWKLPPNAKYHVEIGPVAMETEHVHVYHDHGDEVRIYLRRAPRIHLQQLNLQHPNHHHDPDHVFQLGDHLFPNLIHHHPNIILQHHHQQHFIQQLEQQHQPAPQNPNIPLVVIDDDD